MNYFFDKDDPFILALQEHVARMGNEIPDNTFQCDMSPWNKGKTLTDDHKKLIGKANRISKLGSIPWNKGKVCDYMSCTMKKTYTVIHPNGTVETVVGMKEFCEKHNLSKSNMSQVATGKQKHHKGYRII